MVIREARHLAGGSYTASPSGCVIADTSVNVAGSSYAAAIASASAAAKATMRVKGKTGGTAHTSHYGRKAATVSDSDSSSTGGDSDKDDGDIERRESEAGVITRPQDGALEKAVKSCASAPPCDAETTFTWPKKIYIVEAEFKHLTYW